MASQNAVSTVHYSPALSLICCSACGHRVALSRATMQDQERIVEEIEMMRELHFGCGSAPNEDTARGERRWMEQIIRQRHSERRPDRLAWSA